MPSPLLDSSLTPSLEDLCQYTHCPLFRQFCEDWLATDKVKFSIVYSGCSMQTGWNVKLKKSGRSLCTVYPQEGFFRVLLVIGAKLAPAAELLLPQMSQEMQSLYYNTRLFNGQRWLMVDLEDSNEMYQNLLTLMQLKL